MFRTVLLAASLGLVRVEAAETTTQAPSSSSHAPEANAERWETTASSQGRFSIRLPFRASTSSFHETDPTKDLQYGYFIGGAVDPDIRFLANRFMYRGGKAMAESYLKVAAAPACDGCAVSKSAPIAQGQYKGVDTEVSVPGAVRFSRTVLVGSDLIVLMVVARSGREQEARSDARRFFDSLVADPR
jgi:hypothetical protein